MAATAAANLVTTTRLVETYLPVFVDEVFTAMNTGIIQVDNNPPFPAAGVNSFSIPTFYHTTAAAQTPTADTSLTVKNIASGTMIGVVRRRAEALGIEDVGRMAGSLDEDQVAQEIAKVLAKQYGYDIETALFTYLLQGVIGGAASPLYATHCVDKSSETFDVKYFADALAVFGEHIGMVNTVLMHPTMFWKLRVNEYLTAQANTTGADNPSLSGMVSSYVGNIGSLRLFLNERVYNTGAGGVYDVVVAGPNAVYMGIEEAYNVEYDRDVLKAAGTDIWKARWSNCVHIPGVSYTGTAPTVGGGIADAALGTATNWTAVTGAAPAQSPVVLIKAKAE